jgi:hypothetical protein
LRGGFGQEIWTGDLGLVSINRTALTDEPVWTSQTKKPIRSTQKNKFPNILTKMLQKAMN